MVMGILLFLLGACFAICVYQKLWIVAGVIAFIGLALIIGLEKALTNPNKELVIKKLCLIYVVVDLWNLGDDDNIKVAKHIKRICKELPIDMFGLTDYSLWIKWEAYFRNQYKKTEGR